MEIPSKFHLQNAGCRSVIVFARSQKPRKASFGAHDSLSFISGLMPRLVAYPSGALSNDLSSEFLAALHLGHHALLGFDAASSAHGFEELSHLGVLA